MIFVANKTEWDTTKLLRLLNLAACQVGCRLEKHVVIRTARNGIIHGRAFLGDKETEGLGAMSRRIEAGPNKRTACMFHAGRLHHVCLYVPEIKLNPERFAAVAEHEFMHNLGIHHKDMTQAQKRCSQATDYAKGFEFPSAGDSLLAHIADTATGRNQP